MQNWLRRNYGHYDWGANAITRTRLLFLFLFYPSIFFWGENLVWFWFGVAMLIIAFFMDWFDGIWARHIQHCGPTIKGQYLDQMYDKIMIWPPWLTIVYLRFIHGADYRHILGPVVIILTTTLLAMDIISFSLHHRNYQRDINRLKEDSEFKFDPKHGAWGDGKIKFALMGTFQCFEVASLCPNTGVFHYWWLFADFLCTFTIALLLMANIFAFDSVKGRLGYALREEM